MNTDDDVIARARRGESDAWRELYESLTGRLVVWLRTRPSGDTAATAEDLAADAWLVAAERISDFRGDSSDFAGWLFGIARNHATNARRRTLRRATDLAAEPVDAASRDRELSVADGAASLDWIRRLLAQLPAREGEVIACTEVVGISTATTAQALGISSTAVRVARHRGLARLRNLTAGQDLERHPVAVDAVTGDHLDGMRTDH